MDRIRLVYKIAINHLVLSVCLWAVVSGQQCPARKVVTYNTGLLDTTILAKNRVERRDAITQQLRVMNADVVCLQEMWIGQDVESMVYRLRDVYPHSWSQLHITRRRQHPVMREPACNPAAMRSFYKCCRKQKCVTLKNRKKPHVMARCIAGNCIQLFRHLPQQCITCIAASLGKSKTIFRKCGGNGFPSPAMRTMNEPGLLILSKLPMRNHFYQDYHPYTQECIQRGYLSVDIASLGKVVCTHLTHNAMHYLEPELWIEGYFQTYVEQGNAERTQLIETFRGVSPLILMGDFNVGEMFSPAVLPDLPEEFNRLAYYFDVVPVKRCTLCWKGENPYTGKIKAILNTAIDHIFYKGLKVLDVKRVFTPLDAVLYSGLPLSDHFGVMALVKAC